MSLTQLLHLALMFLSSSCFHHGWPRRSFDTKCCASRSKGSEREEKGQRLRRAVEKSRQFSFISMALQNTELLYTETSNPKLQPSLSSAISSPCSCLIPTMSPLQDLIFQKWSLNHDNRRAGGGSRTPRLEAPGADGGFCAERG